MSETIFERQVLCDVLETLAGLLEEDKRCPSAAAALLSNYAENGSSMASGVRKLCNAIRRDLEQRPQEIEAAQPAAVRAAGLVRVVAPGSNGLNKHKNLEDFYVDQMCIHPTTGNVAYIGHDDSGGPDVTLIVEAEAIEPILGVSELVLYDPDSRQLLQDG